MFQRGQRGPYRCRPLGKGTGSSNHHRAFTHKRQTFIAAPTARHIRLLEGKDGASESSLETVVQSFQAGLQALT
jgi:hypothetical protein